MTITLLLEACMAPWDVPCRALVRCHLRRSNGSWGAWGHWKAPSGCLFADDVPEGLPRPKAQAALDAWIVAMTHPDIEWEGKLDPIPHPPTSTSPSGP